nr:hypothetical protein [Tanacetum cinerariifolium]
METYKNVLQDIQSRAEDCLISQTYDILKQHQNEVNEIRAERIAHVANPLVLVAQQEPVYHPQNHPTHHNQNSSTRSQQAATRNRGKAIVNSPSPIYDQEPSMVAEDDEMSKDKEIDKLMALISLSLRKTIHKLTDINIQIPVVIRCSPRFDTLSCVDLGKVLWSSRKVTCFFLGNRHQHEVNEIKAERIARVANPLALVAQQEPVYHPQNHPTHHNQNSSTRSQQAATRNRGKEIVNSLSPIYDQEPSMVAEDDEMSKDKEIDKLMALISLSFKKIYKPTNNNLRTSSE